MGLFNSIRKAISHRRRYNKWSKGGGFKKILRKNGRRLRGGKTPISVGAKGLYR